MAQDKDRWVWGWSTHGRADLPQSLRDAPDLKNEFENNRCPYNKLAREAMGNSEAENRRGNGDGSNMISKDRPFPELKPRNDNAKNVIRESFNQRWQAEKDRTNRTPDAFDRIDQKKAEREAQTQQQGQRNLGLER